MSPPPARRGAPPLATLAGALLVLGAALTPATPVEAHHAFAAEYDAEKPFDLTGTVTKAKWVNPHSRLFLAVAGTDGSVSDWSFEFGAPNALEGRGLTKADLQPGAKVRVKGFLSKNGGPFGYCVTLILADGRSFQTGGAPDQPAAAARPAAAGN